MITGTCIGKKEFHGEKEVYLRPGHLLLHQDYHARVVDQSDQSLFQKKIEMRQFRMQKGEGRTKKHELVAGRGTGDKLFQFTNLTYESALIASKMESV
jgi:hypothetical protein